MHNAIHDYARSNLEPPKATVVTTEPEGTQPMTTKSISSVLRHEWVSALNAEIAPLEDEARAAVLNVLSEPQAQDGLREALEVSLQLEDPESQDVLVRQICEAAVSIIFTADIARHDSTISKTSILERLQHIDVARHVMGEVALSVTENQITDQPPGATMSRNVNAAVEENHPEAPGSIRACAAGAIFGATSYTMSFGAATILSAATTSALLACGVPPLAAQIVTGSIAPLLAAALNAGAQRPSQWLATKVCGPLYSPGAPLLHAPLTGENVQATIARIFHTEAGHTAMMNLLWQCFTIGYIGADLFSKSNPFVNSLDAPAKSALKGLIHFTGGLAGAVGTATLGQLWLKHKYDTQQSGDPKVVIKTNDNIGRAWENLMVNCGFTCSETPDSEARILSEMPTCLVSNLLSGGQVVGLPYTLTMDFSLCFGWGNGYRDMALIHLKSQENPVRSLLRALTCGVVPATTANVERNVSRNNALFDVTQVDTLNLSQPIAEIHARQNKSVIELGAYPESPIDDASAVHIATMPGPSQD